MINICDTVKVIGTTLNGAGEEKELIKIGTICKVTKKEKSKEGIIVGIVPIEHPNYCEYWYLEKDVEKGRLEWIREEENIESND